MHAGTILSNVFFEVVSRHSVTPFIIGVQEFLDVPYIICRHTADIVIDEHAWEKLLRDTEFKVYVARVMYAIQSAEEIFEEPDDWAIYF